MHYFIVQISVNCECKQSLSPPLYRNNSQVNIDDNRSALTRQKQLRFLSDNFRTCRKYLSFFKKEREGETER